MQAGRRPSTAHCRGTGRTDLRRPAPASESAAGARRPVTRAPAWNRTVPRPHRTTRQNDEGSTTLTRPRTAWRCASRSWSPVPRYLGAWFTVLLRREWACQPVTFAAALGHRGARSGAANHVQPEARSISVEPSELGIGAAVCGGVPLGSFVAGEHVVGARRHHGGMAPAPTPSPASPADWTGERSGVG
jgi:hypothetical protein